MAMTCRAQPGPRVEVGTIEEDAGVLDEASDDLPVLLHPGGAVLALGLELPLLGGESLGGLFDAALILLVGEVRPVTAATLDEFGRWPGEDALAAVAKDAGPVAFEEGDVEHPGALALRVFETHPLVRVTGDRCHRENLVGVTRP